MNESKPFFSVVIPLYNKEKHIKRSIDSILIQTVQDFEIIVVDDGSIDGSADIVKMYEDNRIILIEQENQGVSVARNRGIECAKYDYIAFLDADDEWLTEHLSDIRNMIQSYPKAGLYSTAYLAIEKDGSIINNWKRKSIDNLYYKIDYFKEVCLNDSQLPVHSSAVCIPKYIFEEIGNFAEGHKHGEDMDMWGRIAFHFDIIFNSDISSKYYRDAENRSILHLPAEVLPFTISYNKLIIQFPERIDDVYLLEYVAKQQLNVAKKYIYSCKRSKGRQILRKTKTKMNKKEWISLYVLSFFPSIIRKALLDIRRSL